MAVSTVDVRITPDDGWVLIATNPSFLIVRPSVFHPWYLAMTASGAPATGIEGVFMGTDRANAYREAVIVPPLGSALAAQVYIRITDPPNSSPGSAMHFGVISNQ